MPWHVRTAVHRSTLNLSHIWPDMRSFHTSVLSLMSCCAESRVTGDLMHQGDPVRSLPDFCSKTHRCKYLHLQRSKVMKLILMNVVLVYKGRFHVCFERYICSWNISNNVVNIEKCNRRHPPPPPPPPPPPFTHAHTHNIQLAISNNGEARVKGYMNNSIPSHILIALSLSPNVIWEGGCIRCVIWYGLIWPMTGASKQVQSWAGWVEAIMLSSYQRNLCEWVVYAVGSHDAAVNWPQLARSRLG